MQIIILVYTSVFMIQALEKQFLAVKQFISIFHIKCIRMIE